MVSGWSGAVDAPVNEKKMKYIGQPLNLHQYINEIRTNPKKNIYGLSNSQDTSIVESIHCQSLIKFITSGRSMDANSSYPFSEKCS